MSWLKPKKATGPEQLAQAPQLDGPGYALRATSAAAGRKFRSLTTVAELSLEFGVGWFHLADLKAFLKGQISLAESWAGSQSELYLCRVASIPHDSIAAETITAQPQLPADSVVVLREMKDKLEIVLYLDAAQLERIDTWAQELPQH